MKKRILFIVIMVVLIFTSEVYAIDITIDGEKVVFDNATGQPFIDENGRTQVPLRVTMESFGATINWDNENREAIVKSNDIEVRVPVVDEEVDNPYLLVNDIKVKIDTTAIIKDGRTHLPIRAVVEAFGAKVEWDEENKIVIINKSSANKEDDEDVISYEEFRDMFNYEASFSSFVRIEAKYNGNMNKSEFKEFWESLSDSVKDTYCIKIAKEKQLKNPDYMVNVIFYYYDKDERYIGLGFSKADTNGNAESWLRNPFEEIKLNPVN